ncbi:hypothetical protein SAMN05444920_101644 [Nonomuraea solani]|uniref:Uncharacterized protein n=1 Tax=Nonomuraea solani TaxID=1144553 RepID=A0A1H5UTQ2_9ACTN|nr:hypothetical protein [Nonomuraea solani]SEF78340.1 hypothetical protein SAMN05444920_101644 [Nonomuraea solani]
MNPDQRGSGTGSRDTAQTGRPGLRGLRASVFAVVCVLAALAMHVLAGGPITGLGTIAAATVMTGAGAFVLARRRRSPRTLLAASFAAQYGMHQLFSMGATSMAAHHGTGFATDTGMLPAHAVVATLSAWWLDRGETALAELLLLLACTLPALWRLLITPPFATPRPGLPAARPPAVLASQALAWTLCRRGPPR